ncbi:PRKCSH domain containing protein [Asbolus verrucosus]|uniref:Endoplasmic reticulum lectin 1 n=1 Tax=Asbolus verrucosus TaxID=1661398 RepID=A0A482VQA3_ASBVE|nr:PRKCSH domain containing protein [Asbolus verrucosus]
MSWLPFLNVLFLSVFVCGHDIKGFDDTVLFDIHWPGENTEGIDFINSENIIVTTSHQEKYRCVLPNIQEKEAISEEKYDGPTALELISPLFSQSSCSYRLESYWTYEVCHGRFIRQYHEDREGKKVKLQEYTLGRWDEKLYEKSLAEAREAERDKNTQIPVKKIDNVNLPYVEIVMGNGTLCDLNQNKPRQTRVLYVCYIHGKHEVYSLKETSTCQYEIIILSPLVCGHPKYKPKETGENKINCIPVEDSPNKPYNLVKLKVESAKLRRKSDLDRIRVEFVPPDFPDKEETTAKPPEIKPTDTSPVQSFLAGKNCLTGGTGWWRYEFCYGKSVEQYHIEKDGSKVTIKLGTFNKMKHLEWIEQHPHKRPKPLPQRTQLSHLYSDGTVCDKTGKPRQTEVKLKCLEDSSNMNTVSLYLLEPRYCEYILGVESPLVCDILSRADENGLIDVNDDDAVIESEIPTVNIRL